MLDRKTRLVLATTLATAFGRLAVGQVCLEPELRYDAGRSVDSLVCADLDGDGHVDVIAANRFRNHVSVLLNRVDGSFAPRTQYVVGPEVWSVSSADLNGDGRPDLVVPLRAAGSVAVLLNRGDGTFDPAVRFPVGELPTCAALADLDGDGDVDLAVGNAGSGTVSVLLNHGDGTFAREIEYDVGTDAYYVPSLVAADFDGDGHVDLAAASDGLPSTVTVLHNSGWATFVQAGQYVAHGPDEMIARDLDGDGRPDLAILDQSTSAISVLMNDGSGALTPFVWYLLPAFPHSLVGADIDGDGDLDLIAGTSTHRLDVLLNDGHGVFTSPIEFRVEGYPASIAAADLEGDGDADLVVANGSWGTVSVLRNCAEAGVVVCAGDGSGTACPCGNSSPAGEGAGCLDSRGLGAELRAGGSARLGHDTLILTGADLPDGIALFFQGSTSERRGAGAVFADGLRCAGGSLVRLGAATTSGGIARFPAVGDPSVSTRGGVLAPGSRTYQVLYRDRAGFCTPSAFNLSNGLEIAWRP